MTFEPLPSGPSSSGVPAGVLSTALSSEAFAVGEFLRRQTRRSELDEIMPVYVPEVLEDTPFRFCTPMPLRVGVLKSLHYSHAEIAELLYVSTESVRKYAARFFTEVGMTPGMALRTALQWSDFLTAGWDPCFRRVHDEEPWTA